MLKVCCLGRMRDGLNRRVRNNVMLGVCGIEWPWLGICGRTLSWQNFCQDKQKEDGGIQGDSGGGRIAAA